MIPPRKYMPNGSRRVAARARRTVHQPGVMNKTETAYSNVLAGRLLAGEIAHWAFEPMKLRLADKTFYTPDFMVILLDGTIEFHEVKACTKSGSMLIEDDAAVKIKVAAEKHWAFRFVLVGKMGRGLACEWKSVVVGGE